MESVCAGNRTGGSNPLASAIFCGLKNLPEGRLWRLFMSDVTARPESIGDANFIVWCKWFRHTLIRLLLQTIKSSFLKWFDKFFGCIVIPGVVDCVN